MRTKIPVYASSAANSTDDIQIAIKNANGLQEEFRFELATFPDLEKLPAGKLSLRRLESRLASQKPPIKGLIFCDRKFDNDLSVYEMPPNRIFVSCKLAVSPVAPPFRLYVLYQLASASLALGGELSREVNAGMIHKQPVGCLWDWWTDSTQRAAVMITARICPRCKELLRVHISRPNERIAACLQILDYVRRAMLGESPEVANRIFIAYGHHDDWKDLAALLKNWGLETEYFNRVSTAGTLVAERWQEMLNQSRFAFAVMTPDEAMSGGKKLARQNVIHEIGLCHARLGVRNTAILIADDTERFTNVAGIVHLEFTRGKLTEKGAEIRALLEERGIVDKQQS